MKTLIIGSLISLVAVGLHAQTTVTNVTIKVTTDIVTGSTSNSFSSSLTLAGPAQKDIVRINGLSWAYFVQRANGFTNTFDNWIAKTWAKDNSDVTSAAYNRSISSDTAQKITQGLANGDYSNADVATLTALANKAPSP